MGLSCSCEDFIKGDCEMWWQPGGRSVPPAGATCCECNAPLPPEPAQCFEHMEVYEPEVERPQHPDNDDSLGDEPDDSTLRRHWHQRYDALERAYDDFADKYGWCSDDERFEQIDRIDYRCERCEGLATALDGAADEGGLGFCLIAPGRLIEAHGDYIEMSGGAEMIWKRGRDGALHPRRMTRADYAKRNLRRRLFNARYFWLHGGWKSALRYKLWPAIERRTTAPVMRSLGYHRTYDPDKKRLRWRHGSPDADGMIWVRRQLIACGFEPKWERGSNRAVWRRKGDV